MSKSVDSDKEGIATETKEFQNDVLKKYSNFNDISKLNISIDWIKQVISHLDIFYMNIKIKGRRWFGHIWQYENN